MKPLQISSEHTKKFELEGGLAMTFLKSGSSVLLRNNIDTPVSVFNLHEAPSNFLANVLRNLASETLRFLSKSFLSYVWRTCAYMMGGRPFPPSQEGYTPWGGSPPPPSVVPVVALW